MSIPHTSFLCVLRALAAGGVALALGACSTASPPVAAPATGAAAQPTSAPAKPASTGNAVEISLHYPVGVSGPLAKIIDGYIAQFNTENPTIKVTPVYDGDYPTTAAKVLVDWVLSKDAGDLIVKISNRYSVRSDVSAPAGMPPFDNINRVNYDRAWATDNKDRLLKKWQAAVGV